jgi:hypothetical protein
MPGPRIQIVSQNALDLAPEELEDLRADIAEAGDVDVVVVGRKLSGYGVTWWEVVRIHLQDAEPMALKALVPIVLTASIKWAKRRFIKNPTRPKYVGIYGPDGRIIKSVRLDDVASEVIDMTAEDRAAEKRAPPPLV